MNQARPLPELPSVSRQGLPAGLWWPRASRVEPQDAATLQQNLRPRTHSKNITNPSRMDAAPDAQPIDHQHRVPPTLSSAAAVLSTRAKGQPPSPPVQESPRRYPDQT